MSSRPLDSASLRPQAIAWRLGLVCLIGLVASSLIFVYTAHQQSIQMDALSEQQAEIANQLTRSLAHLSLSHGRLIDTFMTRDLDEEALYEQSLDVLAGLDQSVSTLKRLNARLPAHQQMSETSLLLGMQDLLDHYNRVVRSALMQASVDRAGAMRIMLESNRQYLAITNLYSRFMENLSSHLQQEQRRIASRNQQLQLYATSSIFLALCSLLLFLYSHIRHT